MSTQQSSVPKAFVTGASRGIGKAIAVALAGAGYDVAISARTVRPGEKRQYTESVHVSYERVMPGSLEETAAEIESHGRQALMLPMDLTDYASVGAATQTLLDRWGGVDVLVHNGRYLGPGQTDVFFDIPSDAFKKYFDAHCVSPIFITRALLPYMLEKGAGQIFGISSSVHTRIPPGPANKQSWSLAYAMAKAGGHQLVPTLHVEFAGRGIRALNIEPGRVSTERKAVALKELGRNNFGAPTAVVGAVVAWLVSHPEGRAYAPADLFVSAQAVAKEHKLYDF